MTSPPAAPTMTAATAAELPGTGIKPLVSLRAHPKLALLGDYNILHQIPN